MDEKKPKETMSKEREKEKGRDEAKKASDQQPTPAKSNKLLLIGIIAGVLVVEVVFGIIFIKMTAPKPIDEIEAKMNADSLQKIEEESTSMGATTAETPIEVLVNIAGTEGERFLKAAVVLEYQDKEAKKSGGKGEGEKKVGSPLGEAILQRMPKYKSYLIESLSKMTFAEISAPEAKEKIRKDLLRMVNGTLPPKLGEVGDIYFTQFIIQ